MATDVLRFVQVWGVVDPRARHLELNAAAFGVQWQRGPQRVASAAQRARQGRPGISYPLALILTMVSLLAPLSTTANSPRGTVTSSVSSRTPDLLTSTLLLSGCLND